MLMLQFWSPCIPAGKASRRAFAAATVTLLSQLAIDRHGGVSACWVVRITKAPALIRRMNSPLLFGCGGPVEPMHFQHAFMFASSTYPSSWLESLKASTRSDTWRHSAPHWCLGAMLRSARFRGGLELHHSRLLCSTERQHLPGFRKFLPWRRQVCTCERRHGLRPCWTFCTVLCHTVIFYTALSQGWLKKTPSLLCSTSKQVSLQQEPTLDIARQWPSMRQIIGFAVGDGGAGGLPTRPVLSNYQALLDCTLPGSVPV